ncbi:MAG: tetratricopeptide repeat protein [Bacilli bacterium]
MNEQHTRVSLLLSGGFHEEALEALQELRVSQNPDDRYFAADAYLSLGFIEEAHALINELHNAFPLDEETALLYAEVLIEMQQEEEAIEVLNSISPESPFYVQSLLVIADVYQVLGLEEVVESKLQEADQLAPNEPAVTFACAEWAMYKGDYGKALQKYKSIYNVLGEAQQLTVAGRIALCHEMCFQYEEACDAYAAIDPEDLTNNQRYHYAHVLLQLERPGNAKQLLEQIIADDDRHAEAFALLGRLYEDEAKYDEAEEYIGKAYALQDTNGELPFLLARLAYRRQDLVTCAAFLKEALELKPHHFESRLLLGRVYVEEGAYGDCIQLLEPLVDEGEDDPSVLWMLGFAFYQSEQLELALKYYQLAYTFYTDNAAFLEEFTDVLLQNGYREQAYTIVRMLLDVDPHHERANDWLMDLELDME